MERLTDKLGPARYCLVECTDTKYKCAEDCGDCEAEHKALDKLGEYENTGYSPADFDRLCREMSSLRVAAGLDTYENLREAIKPGCVLILPCPIGAPVYVHERLCKGPRRGIDPDCMYSRDCTRLMLPCPLRVVKRAFTVQMHRGLGRTFWLTEEEAEAAIPADRRNRPR